MDKLANQQTHKSSNSNELNNIVAFDLKIDVDMSNQNAEITDMKVAISEDKLTFKQKMFQLLEDQIEEAEKRLKDFETGIPESEQSEQFKTQKAIANEVYWTVARLKKMAKLL